MFDLFSDDECFAKLDEAVRSGRIGLTAIEMPALSEDRRTPVAATLQYVTVKPTTERVSLEGVWGRAGRHTEVNTRVTVECVATISIALAQRIANSGLIRFTA